LKHLFRRSRLEKLKFRCSRAEATHTLDRRYPLRPRDTLMRRIALSALAVALCLLTVGLRVRVARQIPEAPWVGTENERVAAALAKGKGFCDAFGAGTGPTAHVSPLYPLLLSGVYRWFGTYETATGRLAQKCLAVFVATIAVLCIPFPG